MTILSSWQHGTQQNGDGHSAEFNLPDIQYQRLEHEGAENQPQFVQFRARGRSAMQRNFLRWLESAQMALGWAVILVILAVASGVYLQQVSQTAITGRSAELLDIELSDLQYANNQVRQQITKEQSLLAMERRSNSYTQPFVAPVISAEDYVRIVIPAADAPLPPLIEAPVLPPETFAEALRLHIVNYFRALGRGIADGE